MGMLQDGAEWLDTQRKANLSVTVTYDHDGTETSASATVGETEFDIEDERGVLRRVVSRDFIISVADLSSEPTSGDRITDDGRLYEVVAPADNPVFRYSDPFYKAYRIHTQYIGSA